MMHPGKASLPLLFLFTFAAILLYSYHYHSSAQLSLRENPNRLSIPRLNPILLHQRFSFTVKVLTFDRIESLHRCLRSLASADFGGDRVNIHVFVDHFHSIDATNGSDARVNGKLEESRRILDLVDGFEWLHGEKLVLYRTGNAGLQAQWLEAWWPVSNDDFAFVVEDDLEVSPLFYKYLKALILNYYYDMSNYSPLIYGVSLQRPRFVAGKHGNKLQVDRETHLFLYQIVGTWGQLLFPKPWKEFRLWYDAHKAKDLKPNLNGMVTTGWYKKMGEKIWTPWFIKFIHANGYYNIYTNFLHERALTISHRDAGVNYGKTAGPDSNLLDERSLDFNIWKMQPLKKLKWYDFCFREVLWRFVGSYDELASVLGSMQKQKPVMIVSLYRTTNEMAKNLLCHLDKINLRNVIFIGGKLELIRDLTQRGHAAIDSEKLINSIGSYKTVSYDPARTEIMKEILAKSIVVKKSIELGYDSWVIDGNFIPLSDFLSELPGPSCNFFVAKSFDMMFVRNSQASFKIWVDDFISRLVTAAASSMESNLVNGNNMHFAYFSRKMLEDSGIVEVCTFDELMFGVKIGADTLHKASVNNSKMIFWSGNNEKDSMQRWLNDMEMWLIDEDLSCVSVVCHQQ